MILRKHRAQHSEGIWQGCSVGWVLRCYRNMISGCRTLFSASRLTYQGQSSAFSSSSKQNSSVRWNACLVIQVAGYAGESKNFISTWSMQAKYRYTSGDKLPIYYQVWVYKTEVSQHICVWSHAASFSMAACLVYSYHLRNPFPSPSLWEMPSPFSALDFLCLVSHVFLFSGLFSHFVQTHPTTGFWATVHSI